MGSKRDFKNVVKTAEAEQALRRCREAVRNVTLTKRARAAQE